MHKLEQIKQFLKEYDGKTVQLMEVCGSHTAAISKYGIRNLLSPKIKLVSGPGCPVCVTPSAYIDRLIELALTPGCCVVTFGDLLRVPGSVKSLSQAKGEGARVSMVYSPMDTLTIAKKAPDTTFIFAAVGFETTTPIYTLLIEQAMKENVTNLKILTSLKQMPPVIEWLCDNKAPVDGFLTPGHVCVITGSDPFVPLALKYQLPFVVAGFTGEELLAAIYGLVKMQGQGRVANFYPSVVTKEGNKRAQEKMDKYFQVCSAVWRGMGEISDSGRVLREEYADWDAGSRDLVNDKKANQACRCDQVLMGKITPNLCPLYGKVCTPLTPQGACMVSSEGCCYQHYINDETELK